ncbi:MAG: glycosyltransferase family 2 protein [Hymenobacter sp.]|nr:MAG: glycosyltransferase family 2 protein [Hymenobacter sp.]
MTSEIIPAFSIIIPVYNGQQVIKRCIESILGQSHQKFELVIIDDGSTDQTQQVCEEYQRADERIKYHKQPNKGVSSARNRGIQAAQNEYILFVDADDYVLPSFLQSFSDIITTDNPTNKTFIFQDFLAEIKFADGREESFNWCKFPAAKFTVAETFRALSNTNWLNWGVPFAKIYRRSIIIKNNISFNEKVSFREDLLFMLDYMAQVDTLIFDPTANYCYTIDNTKPSLSSATASFDNEVIFFSYSKQMSESYIDKFKLNSEVQLVLNKMVYASFFRCINSCMYKYKVPMQRIDRINNIKLLSTKENLDSLLKSDVIDSGVKKFAFFLLKNKLYDIYDIVNNARFSIS